MKVKFKPGPAAKAKSVSFDGFDGMVRTCKRYKLKKISGHGQAAQALRCAEYKNGPGKPPCRANGTTGRKVKARSPGLLRGSLQKPHACGRKQG